MKLVWQQRGLELARLDGLGHDRQFILIHRQRIDHIGAVPELNSFARPQNALQGNLWGLLGCRSQATVSAGAFQHHRSPCISILLSLLELGSFDKLVSFQGSFDSRALNWVAWSKEGQLDRAVIEALLPSQLCLEGNVSSVLC